MAKRIVEIVVKVTGSKKLGELAGGLQKAGGLAVDAAKAATALAAAISAMTIASAKSVKELQEMSRQAKLSTKDFQALAFATKQYGVNAEQIADISKDVADRLGEFATAGTGTFQDFADVMKISKEEAQALAVEWQNLSSDQVIGEMVKQMEAAGATGNQVTFVLESMGNDLSKLAPLFANNSAELNRLTGAFLKLNSQLQLSETEIEALNQTSIAFDKATSGLGLAADKISATIAPVVTGFFNELAEIIPDATVALVDFINTFLSAGSITDIAAIDRQIADLQEDILARENRINKAGRQGQVARKSNVADQERINELLERRVELTKEQEKLTKSSSDTTGGSSSSLTGDEQNEFKLLAERIDRETDQLVYLEELKLTLRQQGYSKAAEAQQIALANELFALDEQFVALEEQYKTNSEALATLDELYQDRRTQVEQKGSDDRVAIAKQEAAQKNRALLIGANNFINGLQQLNPKSDALKRAAIISNTAVAVMETFANGGGMPWAAAQAAVMAAIGAKQLSQVGKKSGSVGNVGGGGSSNGASSIGSSLSSQTAVNNVESTELIALRNDLASLDPDEVLPVSYTRRIMLSLNNATTNGVA